MQIVQLNFINLKAYRNSIAAMLPKFKKAAQSSHYQFYYFSSSQTKLLAHWHHLLPKTAVLQGIQSHS